MPLLKDISNQTVAFSQVQSATVIGHDPSRILTAMLEHRQGVVNGLIHGSSTDNTNNSAHVLLSTFSVETRGYSTAAKSFT